MLKIKGNKTNYLNRFIQDGDHKIFHCIFLYGAALADIHATRKMSIGMYYVIAAAESKIFYSPFEKFIIFFPNFPNWH